MKSVASIGSLKGKRVLIRVDYNVPLKRGTIVDARRIESSYQTIDAVLKKGGTPVLIAHLGDGTESLSPIARFLTARYKLLFLTTDIADRITAESIERAQKGSVVLLENIRRYPGEEKNTAAFAKALAKLGEVYINDAFSVSHRAHASVVGLPKLMPAYAGFQLVAEVAALSSAFAAKTHPFLFILGGAKFSTKIPLIDRFSTRADHMVIAGAILNTFYKAAGFEVGVSVVESGYDTAIKKLLHNPKLLLSTDVVVQQGKKTATVSADEVKKTDKIVDIGPESADRIVEKIKKAKLIVWNGPTGWYEEGFDAGTITLAKACATTRGQVIVGGGDTAAVIEKVLKGDAGKKKNIFLSTGGGATLDFLSNGTLPGIKALGQ
jgi:phosphoglycerate kinase